MDNEEIVNHFEWLDAILTTEKFVNCAHLWRRLQDCDKALAQLNVKATSMSELIDYAKNIGTPSFTLAQLTVLPTGFGLDLNTATSNDAALVEELVILSWIHGHDYYATNITKSDDVWFVVFNNETIIEIGLENHHTLCIDGSWYNNSFQNYIEDNNNLGLAPSIIHSAFKVLHENIERRTT